MVKFLKKTWWAPLVVLLIVGIAFAETHTRFVTGNPVYQPRTNEVAIISNTLDFSDLRTPGSGTAGILSGVTRGDTVQLLDIPAGAVVNAVGVVIKTAWTTSGVTCAGITIGDGADPDGWLTAVDFGNTASGVSSTYEDGVSGVYQTTSGGKYYSTADTIDAVMPDWAKVTHAGLTDAVVIIWAEIIKPSTGENYTKP